RTTATSGMHATDKSRTVFDGLLSMEPALTPHPLDQQTGALIHQNTHGPLLPLDSLHHLVCGVCHAIGDAKIEAGLRENLPPLFHVRALHAHDHGHVNLDVRHGLEHAMGKDITA